MEKEKRDVIEEACLRLYNEGIREGIAKTYSLFINLVKDVEKETEATEIKLKLVDCLLEISRLEETLQQIK